MNQRLLGALSRARKLVRALLSALLSAALWMFVIPLAGMALIVSGIDELAGRSWASIAAGVFLLLTAGFLRRGMTRG